MNMVETGGCKHDRT